MARSKLTVPENFSFSTKIPIRITDVNYGGHVGNDAILSLLHEARMQFLKHHNLTELDFGGASLIMTDVTIEFKNELFYGDNIIAHVGIGEFSSISFDIFYKLLKEADGSLVTLAKTGMVCYDYGKKKIVAVPQAARLLLNTLT